MKLYTYSQAKDFVHDASGIEDTDIWLWGKPINSITNVLYPIAKLETYLFAGQVTVMYTIDNVLHEGNVHVKTCEHGGEDYEAIDYIEWSNNVPELNDNVLEINDNVLEDDQDIIDFLEANFVDYIQDAETL